MEKKKSVYVFLQMWPKCHLAPKSLLCAALEAVRPRPWRWRVSRLQTVRRPSSQLLGVSRRRGRRRLRALRGAHLVRRMCRDAGGAAGVKPCLERRVRLPLRCAERGDSPAPAARHTRALRRRERQGSRRGRGAERRPRRRLPRGPDARLPCVQDGVRGL